MKHVKTNNHSIEGNEKELNTVEVVELDELQEEAVVEAKEEQSTEDDTVEEGSAGAEEEPVLVEEAVTDAVEATEVIENDVKEATDEPKSQKSVVDLKNKGTSGKVDFEKLFKDAKEWVLGNTKIVIAALLAVCVLITLVVALGANKKGQDEDIQALNETEETVETQVPELALEQDAYPVIADLFQEYFTARVNGDMDTIVRLNPSIESSDSSQYFFQEISNYVEAVEGLEVYTKVGPIENSYIAYVKYNLKLHNFEDTVPGIEAYYVPMREDGTYYIVDRDETDKDIENYIVQITLQDDVIELYNKVTVEYNDLIASNEELGVFLTEMYDTVTSNVGQLLAAKEAETVAETSVAEESTPAAENAPETIVEKVSATVTVNIRASDSENADKLGKAYAGDTFEVVEMKENGWVGIKYEGQTAFIKGEFLEVVSEIVVDSTTGEQQSQPVESAGTANGYVTAKTTVNIRAAESETADKLGVIYQGEQLELIMKQADGWCKVNYKGRTAYVKSEFVE